MKKWIILFLLLFATGCSSTDESYEATLRAFAEASPTQPELLIAPRMTPTAPKSWYGNPVAAPTRTPAADFFDQHVAQNIYSPTPGGTNFDRACRIKGNVSLRNKEEKIYHCPNWRDYDRTDVNIFEGDKWFCTEAEAIAAGFRRPANAGSAVCEE